MHKDKAFLFGPYVGDIFWEMLVFAPHVIYLKKLASDVNFVVYTRPESFDLYGTYANILVPLKINKQCKQDYYRLVEISEETYVRYATLFKGLYQRKFDIVRHIYPDISPWRYSIKWQFSRDETDYSFSPRRRNAEQIKLYLGSLTNFSFVDFTDSDILLKIIKSGKVIIDKSKFLHDFSKFSYDNITLFGCMIELIKLSDYVIGNLNSIYSRLSLLLGKPVISLNEKMNFEQISLINPLKTPVINCSDVVEGIKIYENNF